MDCVVNNRIECEVVNATCCKAAVIPGAALGLGKTRMRSVRKVDLRAASETRDCRV